MSDHMRPVYEDPTLPEKVQAAVDRHVAAGLLVPVYGTGARYAMPDGTVLHRHDLLALSDGWTPATYRAARHAEAHIGPSDDPHPQADIYAPMRAALVQQIVHVRKMAAARYAEAGTPDHVARAVQQAYASAGRNFTSKSQAASALLGAVNRLLTSQGHAARSARTLRKYILDSYVKK